ncbi:MAG: hypothetical protein JXB39_08790 [Deltaproteobacteria bacterium]|nr:hypothetical protein [Deltaproteobacteria bacterium]
MHSLLLVVLGLAACSGGDPVDDTGPAVPHAGRDVDERTTRPLSSSYALPQAFYDALDTLGVLPEDLTYPDAGATFEEIPTRMHWTDTLRHQGDQGPAFGFMVAEDVEAALLWPEPDEVLRELLVAQYTYQDRDAFVTSRYDERFEALDEADPLLAALRAFYEHAPVEGHPEAPTASWTEIEASVAERIAAFPDEVALALSFAVQGLVRAAELRDEALASKGVIDWDTWAALHDAWYRGRNGFSTRSHDYGTQAFEGLDLERMSRAGQLALRSVESLRLALRDVDPVPGATLDLLGPLGRIQVSLDATDDTWDGEHGDWFLALDLAGNDTWLDHVAVNTSIWLPVSVALDVRGDDTWRTWSDWVIEDATISTSDARGQGLGLFGVAILDDGEGDDVRHASAATQGVGVFGVGVAADHAGNDTWEGYYIAQGFAEFGFGLLVDLGGGADRYETMSEAQGYGGPKGIGWIVDDGGNDAYEAIADPIIWDWAGEGSNWTGGQGFGFGVRDGFFTSGEPIFSGGLGGLFDLSGDDDYTCAVMCQGFGYFFGTGLFYDPEGDDDHLVTHKYAMGDATHQAVGLYVDGEGSDTYRNNDDDECIGEGYDVSTAFHLDLGPGDDVYTIDHYGQFTLGVALHPALGLLLNEAGDEVYSLPDATYALGRSTIDTDDRSGYLAGVPAVGMFLDLGGTDTYGGGRAETRNGAEWIQTEPLGGGWDPDLDHGYGLDTE